jgi:hypothetical protein
MFEFKNCLNLKTFADINIFKFELLQFEQKLKRNKKRKQKENRKTNKKEKNR